VEGSGGVILDTRRDSGGGLVHEVRGGDTTGLEARAVLQMAHLPTSIRHLLDRDEHPLVSGDQGDHARRIRGRLLSPQAAGRTHQPETRRLRARR
jgi:hypothetical protein